MPVFGADYKGDKYDPYDPYNPWDPKKPDVPITDPRYQTVQQAQIGRARQFRSDLPKYAESQDITRGEKGRARLASEMTDIDRSASRRGLLYGGGRLKERAGARGALAQEMAGGRAASNVQGLDLANVLRRQAVETGFGIAGAGQEQFSAQQAADRDAMEQALMERQMRGQALKSGAGFLGKLGGAAASKMFGKDNTLSSTLGGEY